MKENRDYSLPRDFNGRIATENDTVRTSVEGRDKRKQIPTFTKTIQNESVNLRCKITKINLKDKLITLLTLDTEEEHKVFMVTFDGFAQNWIIESTLMP